MKVILKNDALSKSIDLGSPIDITIPVGKRQNVNCYFLDDPLFSYFESPQFSGNLSEGGSVNCERVNFYPHASGTHTECALHVLQVDFDMRHVKVEALQFATLFTIEPTQIGADKVITRTQLEQLTHNAACMAIVIRSLPNEEGKRTRNYSDTNPPYFEPEALAFLREAGYKHLLTDLPSVDKESDEGRLAAHKYWFLNNGVATPDRTITEFVYVSDSIKDGLYGLSMQFPSMQTDAVPSRILLYPCE